MPLFSLLALVTSVLGVGLGCVDFMEEAIDHSKEQMTRLSKPKTRRVQATALTFGPALLVAAMMRVHKRYALRIILVSILL